MTCLTVTVEHEAVSHPEVVQVTDGIADPVEHVNRMKDLTCTLTLTTPGNIDHDLEIP